ncbi:TspO/MBR family protein [Alterisphingorhabdus coralli]|uniref:TspO/MBR family protein n=1 Tax=Alterisphingorhabdus coralli TaxID=3071408 RepID=A0AA97I2E9_9SPHN|nr:TspO/MBR family protein [Parasphingorhabdus sp. SCSIO 66989]WOE75695.1 TspO/MBR family protein [Parasphingorhabdus sp. SCSIO 66989]
MISTPIFAAILWAVILGGLGGALTKIGPWYRNLKKPSWQPPDWLFGPAWTVILGLAAWAAILSWNAAGSDVERLSIIIAYAVNFLCHFAWSPLFFTWQRPDWALIEVVFLWFSVLALLIVTSGLSTLAGVMIVPYLLWVSFAAILNAKIVQLNRPFSGLTA